MTAAKISRKGILSVIAAIAVAFAFCGFIMPSKDAKAEEGASGYVLKVNTQENVVTVYEQNGEDLKPVRAMICSCGLLDGEHDTPLGEYTIQKKWRWQKLFHGVAGQYVSQFDGDYLFHSEIYKEYGKADTCFRAEYEKLGENASQGCVRLQVMDAKWIYDNCGQGTKVVIYQDKDPGPLGKPEAIPMEGKGEFGWDPTDPAEENEYFQATGSDVKVKKVLYLEYGANFDISDIATAKNPYTMEDTTNDFSITHVEYQENKKTPIINVPQLTIDTKASGTYTVNIAYEDRYNGKESEYENITIEVAHAEKTEKQQ